MNKVILSYEFLRMRRSIATISLFVFVILASSYSIWSGLAWQTSHQGSLSEFVEQIDKKGSEWRSDLEDIESGKSQSSPCLLYTSPSPRDATLSRMPSSA